MSHLRDFKRSSYQNRADNSSENGVCRRESHRFARSMEPILPLTGHFPFAASEALILPARQAHAKEGWTFWRAGASVFQWQAGWPSAGAAVPASVRLRVLLSGSGRWRWAGGVGGFALCSASVQPGQELPAGAGGRL
jgi:hypothetical protein